MGVGSANTTNAVSKSSITIMEGDMSWEELYRELQPNIPEDAKTVRMLMEETGMSDNWIRVTLEKKIKNDGWNKQIYKGVAYYWPPE